MEHTAEAELEKLFFSCEEFKDKDFRRRLSSREIGPRRRQRRASPRLGGMRGHAAPALFLDAATAWRNAEETKKQENGEARLAHHSRLLCFFSEMAETEAVAAACDMFLAASLREQGRTWRASGVGRPSRIHRKR